MQSTTSQCALILAHLQEGFTLTPLEAERFPFHCMRLGARIFNLRRAGHPIVSTLIKTPSGKHVAEYRLLTADEIAA